MLKFAQFLCKDFIFVRVDFYSINNRIYFGEMAFTPLSGVGKWFPEEQNLFYGNLIELPLDRKKILPEKSFAERGVPALPVKINLPKMDDELKKDRENAILKAKDREIMDLKSIQNRGIDKIYDILSKARIDVKLRSQNKDGNCGVSCKKGNASISTPSWFQKDGVGYVVNSLSPQELSLDIECYDDGALELAFRTIDFKDLDGKRINYLVDVCDIIVNGISIVSKTKYLSISHDKPFTTRVDCKKGQLVQVIFKYELHYYEYTEFRNLLSRMMIALK